MSFLINSIGWIASVCLALCALPQAVQSVSMGNSRGLSPYFLWLWFIGELLMIFYVVFKIGFDLPLLTNYILNFLLLLVIMKFKYFERIKNV